MIALLWLGCNRDRPPVVAFEEVPVSDEIHLVTDFAFLSDDELVAVTILGELVHYDVSSSGIDERARYPIDEAFPEQPGCGIISVAPSPRFESDGYLYLGLCTGITSTSLLRVTLTDEGPTDPLTLMSFEEPAAEEAWHQIGDLQFSGDVLFFGMGEMTIREHAQDVGDPLGKLIRIVPTEDGYEPASGNPAESDDDWVPEAYASGLRSPWTAARDSDGRYWVADVGSTEFEEVNRAPRGANLGWPVAEGPCEEDCGGLTDPVVAWSRESTTSYVQDDPEALPAANSVGWVAELSPQGEDPYDGAFDRGVLFGDMCYGWIRQLVLDDEGAVERDVHVGHLDYVAGVTRGPGGYAYFGSFGMCLAKGDPGPWSLWRAVVAE